MVNKKVDLTRIKLIAVVDADDNWGYAPVNGVAGIRLEPGSATGTFIGHLGDVYQFAASDPSVAKGAAPLSADATYNPDVSTYNLDAPPNPDAT